MPDEAIYAERTLAFWHHGSLPLLHGEGAGYGVLYPVVAGIGLAWGGFTDGYAWLKVLQALVVSLTAVPVFLYGRRLMSRRYALLAAELTVASPLLLYSGLVMRRSSSTRSPRWPSSSSRWRSRPDRAGTSSLRSG